MRATLETLVKKILPGGAGLCMTVAFACGISTAQTTANPPEPAPTSTPAAAPNDHDINRTELNNFDEYLDSHPDVHKALNGNPSLINNPGYLEEHPGLQQFLNNHPGVKEEATENPKQFINREDQFMRNGGDISRAEAGRFDNYLDQHPKLAKQLSKNPKLVDNPTFLANHPGFYDYLQKHPEIREDIKQHPYAFEKRERQYERHEGPEPVAHVRGPIK